MHDHSRGKGGMLPGKFCKMHLKIRILCILEISFRQYCFCIFLFLGSEGGGHGTVASPLRTLVMAMLT